tara:strand:- start:28869 stop:29828 length:960 start_codon:yes stop_codon:yes gene_type:complete
MRVTKRDEEILRTLVRVQLARTMCLQWVFFPSMGVARKRLHILRGYGLITTHSKGLPGNLAVTGGQYWRLTARGLDVVLAAYPNEYEPDNLIVRTKRASLRYFEHRDEVVDTYLRLLYTSDQNIDEIRTRADGIHWRGEYEVELASAALGDSKACVIPDATLVTQGRRLFLEIDRSTESHARCKRTIKRYANTIRFGHYRERFPDDLPASVVYITKSERRAQGLQKLMDDSYDLPYTGLAMTTRRASSWLLELTTGVASSVGLDPLETDLREARTLLGKVYQGFRTLAQAASDQGLPGARPDILVEAYEYLTGLKEEAA